MNRKVCVAIVGMFCFLLILAVTQVSAKVFHWKFASYVPSANKSLAVGQKKWADEIERRSNGQIKIQIFWAGELIGPREMPNALKSGLVDVIGLSPAYTPGQTPLWNVIYMPFLAPTRPDHCLMVYNRIGRESKLLIEEMAKFNAVYVGAHDSTSYNMIGQKPVRTTTDLKGLRVRCMADHGKILGKFGGVTVSMPATEMYSALDRGLIDSVAFAFEGFGTWKLHEISKYVTLDMDMGALACVFWLNKDRWNELPDHLKEVVQSVVDDHPRFVTDLVYRLFDETLEQVNQRRIEITNFPKSERQKLLAAAPDVWEEWAKRTNNYEKAKAVLSEYIEIRDKIVEQYPRGILDR